MTAKDISFDNPTESYKVVGDHHKGTYTSNTHPDNSQNTDHVMGGSNNQHSFDTPNILLEQLAYMDTFMPTLGQNFMGSGHLSFSNSGPSLGSILLQNENENSNRNSNGDHNNNDTNGGGTGFEFSLDEQLALELSAFADEDFVFAGEEKPRDTSNDSDNNNNNNNNVDSNDTHTYYNKQNEEKEGKAGSEEEEPIPRDGSEHPRVNKATRNTHFLTQRKNISLISQYDQSKSRFSSARGRKVSNIPELAAVPSTTTTTTTTHRAVESEEPEFLNFEGRNAQHTGISSETVGDMGSGIQIFQSPPFEHGASPLSNLLFSAPRFQEPISNKSMALSSYSKLPLSTLISAAKTVPVPVPAGARQTLLNAGLTNDHIGIIAAIVAYHEQGQSHDKQSSRVHHPTRLKLPQQVSSSDRNQLKESYLSLLLKVSSSNDPQFLHSITEKPSESYKDFIQQTDVTTTTTTTAYQNNLVPNSTLLSQLNPYNQQGDMATPGYSHAEGHTETQASLSTTMETQQKDYSLGVHHTDQSLLTARGDTPQSMSVTELMGLVSSLQERIRMLEGENRLLKELVRGRDTDKDHR